MKLCSLLLVFAIVLFMCSCNKNIIKDNPKTTSTTETTTRRNVLGLLPSPDAIILSDPDSYIVDDDGNQAYRAIYYNIPGSILCLGDRTRPNENWIADEMLIVTFVKHHDITKEIFIAAVQEMYERYSANGWDLTEEGTELPNPDIIFTFDNEIINAYYRRENPVVPDWLTNLHE